MNYTYVIGENSITLINISNGNRVCIFAEDSRYEAFRDAINVGDFAAAEMMDTKTIVESFTKDCGLVKIVDGVGTIQISGKAYPLQDTIVNRIIKMELAGVLSTPLVSFLEKLYSNPSKTAIDELFLFLDATDLPITIDGDFIAYKIVKHNYKDIYTENFDNSVGQVLSMPRFEVDDKRENTCSTGFHFCNKDYLKHYGSSNKEDDRCMLVKINPADVVSIPVDYNNAKGRTSKYVVVGEMNDKDWREILSQRDYNTFTVADEDGSEFLDDDLEYEDEYEGEDDDTYSDYLNDSNTQTEFLGGYRFNKTTNRWHNIVTNKMVSRQEVMNSGYQFAELLKVEHSC